MGFTPIRIDTTMYARIAELAGQEQRSNANMTNVLLAYALNHYPEGLSDPVVVYGENHPETPIEILDAIDEIITKVDADTEQACCKSDRKLCKHWQWTNADDFSTQTNTLSNRTRQMSEF